MKMADESQGVPVTWRELLASDTGETLSVQLARVPSFLESETVQRIEVFGGASAAIAGVSILLGDKALEPVINEVRSHLDVAMQVLELLSTLPSRLLGFLSTLSTLECTGLVTAPFGGANASHMLDEIAKDFADFVDMKRHRAGLAAVAVGRNDLVPKFVGGGKLPARIKPGETFQFNVPGFVRYMAVAAAKGASADDVQPAWLDFVGAFPRKLAADTLDWPDLMWAGRIYYLGFEKRPVAEVADAIRALVTQEAS